jgi:Protein of unknown function (DUF1552)
MILTNKSLSRRTVLRGIGATVALPFLDAMKPAFGAPSRLAAKAPIRLGFVYHPVGRIMDQWTPATEGTGFAFTPTMKALEPFRDQLTIFSGLAQMQGDALGDGPGDHARDAATWLTGVHPKKTEGPVSCGISADQIAAKELGKETQLASLELTLESTGMVGNCDSGYSCAYTNTVCWRDAATPLPMESSPRAIFERLFGDNQSTDPAARMKTLQEESSLLDYVAGSIDRLETELGNSDRSKLSRYLESIRDVERRIQKAEQQNASMKMPVMERPGSIPDNFDEYAKLMIDLQILAYQTDMTRVITFMFGRANSNMPFPFIGVPDGHHSISHHLGDKVKIANVAKIDAYLVGLFAYYLQKMKSTPDGDGNLLDHSIIVHGSSLSDANVHLHYNLPIALVSGQFSGNRHLLYPKGTPLNNLLLNVLDKAGVRTDHFGDSTGELAGV